MEEMMEKKAIRKKGKGGFKGIVDAVKTLLWAGAIAILIRSLIAEPFSIPSSSMVPNLLVGDYLFVTKFSYGYSRLSFPWGRLLPFEGRVGSWRPQAGDVVVFRPPGQPDTDFIKRVIGQPGDRIQLRDGGLWINDQQVARKRIEDYVDPDSAFATPVAQYIETLPNGTQHRVIEASGDNGYLDNTPVYLVPEGHYFMMGDNRDNSADSRAPRFGFGNLSMKEVLSSNDLLYPVGFVPADNLIGPAQVLFWSYTPKFSGVNPVSWVSEIRFSRIFDAIR